MARLTDPDILAKFQHALGQWRVRRRHLETNRPPVG